MTWLHIVFHRMVATGHRVPWEWEPHISNFQVTRDLSLRSKAPGLLGLEHGPQFFFP